jgi:RNA polymerase sigma-70 factor, ECF subfamily
MTFQVDRVDDDVLALLGDRDWDGALRLVMQRYGQDVFRFCCRMLRDSTLADDVHQQVFLAAYRDLRQFTGRSTVRSWLFGIARHRVLDAARSRARRGVREVELDGVPEVSDPRPLAIDSLDERQLRGLLDEVLDALSEPARVALLLRYQQGLSFEEIAESCGENAAVLRMRVSRALRRLRVEIESRNVGTATRRQMRVAA